MQTNAPIQTRVVGPRCARLPSRNELIGGTRTRAARPYRAGRGVLTPPPLWQSNIQTARWGQTRPTYFDGDQVSSQWHRGGGVKPLKVRSQKNTKTTGKKP